MNKFMGANVVFSPEWFYSIDAVLSLIGIIIALTLGAYTYKIYGFLRKKKYQYFSYAFFAIAVGSLIRLIMNSSVYFFLFNKSPPEFIGTIAAFALSKDVITLLGFFAGHFLTLLGFMTIFFIAHDLASKKLYFLLAYLIAIAAWFSNALFFSYHLTSAVILLGIFVKYYQNFKITGNKLVVIAFGLFTIAEIAFLFLAKSQEAFVIGEVIYVFAFIFLLMNFFMIKMGNKKNSEIKGTKSGKKKK